MSIIVLSTWTCLNENMPGYASSLYLLVWIIDGNSWVHRVANAQLRDGIL